VLPGKADGFFQRELAPTGIKLDGAPLDTALEPGRYVAVTFAGAARLKPSRRAGQGHVSWPDLFIRCCTGDT